MRLIPSTRGNVIVGLDEAVRRMSLGETSMVLVRYDHAYGNFCVGAHIPPRANLIFKVQLLQINHLGRWQLPYRVIIRLRRFFRRFMQRFRNHMAYHRAERPWHRKVIQFLQYLGILEAESEVIANEVKKPAIEMEDEEGEDNYSEDSNEMRSNRFDSRLKAIVTKSAVAGAVYQWGYKPRPMKSSKKSIRKPGPPIHDDDLNEADNDEAFENESLTSLQKVKQERNVQISRPQTTPLKTSSAYVPQWVSELMSPGGRRSHLLNSPGVEIPKKVDFTER